MDESPRKVVQSDDFASELSKAFSNRRYWSGVYKWQKRI
jgi:hypothetical protein